MADRQMLGESLDRPIGTLRVSPDSARLYFTAEDQGHERLYCCRASGGTPPRDRHARRRHADRRSTSAGPASTPVAVCLWQSAVQPPEVVRVDSDVGRPHAAHPVHGVAGRRPRSAAGRDVLVHEHARRAHPQPAGAGRPAFDPAKKYPLLVVMHGGPHGAWRDEWVLRWNYHLLGAPGYVVLLTNYMGSTGFGEAFAQRIQGDPLEGPALEINQAADEAIARYPFVDGTRQVAGGASYGGHLANWMAVTTTRYRALVSHAGLFDLAAQWGTSDIAFSRERNMGAPVLEDPATWAEQSPLLRAGQLEDADARDRRRT